MSTGEKIHEDDRQLSDYFQDMVSRITNEGSKRNAVIHACTIR
jgi:hypothetical protein